MRVEGDQVDDLVGIAGELVAQRFVLGTHANGAGVGLTLTHHDAAHRDQGSRADAVFFGPSIAAMTMSRPVRKPPSVRSVTRSRRLFMDST